MNYFFKQAYQDMKSVAVYPLKLADEYFEDGLELAEEVLWGRQLFFVWPFVLGGGAALVLALVIGTVCFLSVLAMHSIMVLAIAIVIQYVAIVLYGMEWAVMRARRGYAKCPHAACHATVPLPAFGCPECGRRHDRLVPGRFGLFRRRCVCGSGRLPTVSWFRKDSLKSFCPDPKCGKPMHHMLFAANMHVPIYGGPDVGKTMFMMAATWQLIEGKLDGVSAEFIDSNQFRDYRDSWREQFESGRMREKTVANLPDAHLISLRRGTGLPLSMYLYDPAGEAMGSGADLGGHRFLRYVDGMALIIDPMLLDGVRREFERSGNPLPPPPEDPIPTLDAVHRILIALESAADLARRDQFSGKLAVIVAKVDLPDIWKAMDVRLEAVPDRGNWRLNGNKQSKKIRGWLSKYEPAVVQLVEARFSNVRYFACSVTSGVEEGSGMAFRPIGVLDALCWLLSSRATMRHPTVSRVIGRMSELVAVSCVVAALVIVPSVLGFAGVWALLGNDAWDIWKTVEERMAAPLEESNELDVALAPTIAAPGPPRRVDLVDPLGAGRDHAN